jgi:murein DD-endopeptidase MepM/ murein hydrolase activator NlpD
MAAVAVADGPPWQARRIRGVRPNWIATARVTPSDWPAEPPSPARIDPNRFAGALEQLCGWMPQGRPLRYADWIVRYSEEFGEDPFLVGALIYARTLGSCRPDHTGPGGVGLTEIDRDMHAPHLRRGVYAYRVLERGRWVARERRMDRFPFGGVRLTRAEENVYFAAALLSVWRDQHESVDAAFEQVPHRHYVSHFVWGDRVRSDRDEDRVLTDRRRLLAHYGAVEPTGAISRLGVMLGCPLDGAPRVISSGIGSGRDGGERSHRGIDLESLPGEPVRAVADGRVVFAGVDLPGRQQNQQMSPDEYDTVPRRSLGRGGRYVCILHASSEGDPLRSCYMHLETVEVETGAEVRRGDRVGTVGRTGMESSAAHLHLELHSPTRVLDPADLLRPLLIGNPAPSAAEVQALMGG